MNDRDAFLRAIAADPADDTVRLAFADWLDEHDEADRAEFIRLQIESARSRGDLEPPSLSPREEDLLSEYRAEWLGPLDPLTNTEFFEYTFRRGFVESVAIWGEELTEQLSELRECRPPLIELNVIGVRELGEHIAANALSELGELRTLRLEDWLLPADAKALATSPHLARLETLSIWVGSRNDRAVCQIIGESRALPSLRRIELVQPAGGSDITDSAARDARTDELARILNSGRRGPLVPEIYRPCSELIPLAPDVGWSLYAGTVPDGRQALLVCMVVEGSCVVLYFDPSGNLLSGEKVDLSGTMHRDPKFGYDEGGLVERMVERIGFRPGTIRVREFNSSLVLPGTSTRIYKYQDDILPFLQNPDDELLDSGGSRAEMLVRARDWFRSGQFCVTHGYDVAWAGPDGEIHTT